MVSDKHFASNAASNATRIVDTFMTSEFEKKQVNDYNDIGILR